MAFTDNIFIVGKTKKLYSKGILATKLEVIGLPFSKAYEFALQTNKELLKKGQTEFQKQELDVIVQNKLEEQYGQKTALKYASIEKWRDSKHPLWILVAGATGTGKTSIARKIAADLGIQHVIGTQIVRGILKKLLAPEITPELYASSYTAHEELRPFFSSRFDNIIIGFENHSRFVNIGVEAILERAKKEQVSVVIEGEHLLPSFFEDLKSSNENVLYVTLHQPDSYIHLENLTSQHSHEREELIQNFSKIRKIHDYLVNETKVRKWPLIDATPDKSPIKELRALIVQKIVEIERKEE